MKVNRHQGLGQGKTNIPGLKTENMAVKQDARAFTSMMIRERCVYCIEFRSREALQSPKLQAPS